LILSGESSSGGSKTDDLLIFLRVSIDERHMVLQMLNELGRLYSVVPTRYNA
jgi:hypothetical protein